MNHFAEGFDESNVIGIPVLDFILGTSKQVFADAINKTRETKTVQNFEHFAYGDNMSESYYHNFMVPIDIKDGNIERIWVGGKAHLIDNKLQNIRKG